MIQYILVWLADGQEEQHRGAYAKLIANPDTSRYSVWCFLPMILQSLFFRRSDSNPSSATILRGLLSEEGGGVLSYSVMLPWGPQYSNAWWGLFTTFTFVTDHTGIQGSRGEKSLGKSTKRDRWAFIHDSLEEGYHHHHLQHHHQPDSTAQRQERAYGL